MLKFQFLRKSTKSDYCKMVSSKYSFSSSANNSNNSFVRDTHTDSIMKPQYDFTKHTILKNLYMFLFNKDNIGNNSL